MKDEVALHVYKCMYDVYSYDTLVCHMLCTKKHTMQGTQWVIMNITH